MDFSYAVKAAIAAAAIAGGIAAFAEVFSLGDGTAACLEAARALPDKTAGAVAAGRCQLKFADGAASIAERHGAGRFINVLPQYGLPRAETKREMERLDREARDREARRPLN